MKFNSLGVVMLAAALGGAFGIMYALGISNEGAWMMAAGLLLAALDIGWRIVRGVPLFTRAGAGTLIFLPQWLWGLAWTVAGAVYYVHGR